MTYNKSIRAAIRQAQIMSSGFGLIFVIFWVGIGGALAAYGLRAVARKRISLSGYNVTHGHLRAFYEGPPAVLIGSGLVFAGTALALSTIGSLLDDELRLMFGIMFCSSPIILAVLIAIARRRYGPIRVEER